MIAEELSITETIAGLGLRGFTRDFHVRADPPELVCGSGRHVVAALKAEMVEVFRFEGVSDPDDEAIVAGLRCTTCGALGILVAGYGPGADAAESEVLAGLEDSRPGRPV